MQLIQLVKHLRIATFIVILIPFFGNAQICTGVGATPVFVEDFGSGVPDYGSALPVGVTNYTNVASTPGDGYYAISKYTTDAGTSAAWLWILDDDHTGNTDGYMMVVNADVSPGEFYRKTVTGLCPNTNYVFSAWIANVNMPSVLGLCSQYVYGNVRFQVENPTNTVLSSVTTGDIPLSSTSTALDWSNYGLSFTTGPGQTSIEIVMVNNAPGGCGNDIVIDDLALYSCVPKVDVTSSSGSLVFCEGTDITLQSIFSQGSYTSPEYQWQYSANGTTWTDVLGATQNTLGLTNTQVSNSGLYRILSAETGNLLNGSCSLSSDTVSITISAPSAITMTPLVDRSKCASTTLTLTTDVAPVNPTPPYTYAWTELPGNTPATGTNNQSSYSAASVTSNTYVVTVSGGCTNTLKDTVIVTSLTDNLSVAITSLSDVCSGDAFSVSSNTTGGYNVSYNWTNVSAPSLSIGTNTIVNINALDAGTYTVQLTAVDTCAYTDTAVQVINVINCSVEIPNVFTPNNDGNNDVFKFNTTGLKTSSIEIYDRWGIKMFTTDKANNFWDGRTTTGVEASEGTYFYIITLTDTKDTKTEYKGFLTLLR